MAGFDVQIPNFAASALGGFQAGQALGKQKLVQSAMQGIDLARPETLTPLLQVDPERGIALLGASSAMLKNERDIASREAATNYLTARFGKSPGASGGSSPIAPGATALPGAPTSTDQIDRSTWDKRADGSEKGDGFLGVIKRPDGTVSSELSVGVDWGQGEQEIPTMVPGLTPDELHWLLTTPAEKQASTLPKSIRDKAIAHAKQRISAGLSPFREANEALPTASAPASPGADEAWRALVAADPEQAMQLREHVDKMDDAQMKRLGEAQDAIATVWQNVSSLPYEQRKPAIAAQADFLTTHHVTPEQIAGFDPTDQNGQNLVGQVLGVKGALEQAAKARAEARAARGEARADRSEARSERADARSAVRFKERSLDRAALAASGGGVRHDVDDLNY